MTENPSRGKDGETRGKVGRPKGVPNKLTRDLRATIEQAFHKAGGRDYLVRVAKSRPDVFLALVGKIIPQETRVSLMASYQAMPIPVEARDALPAIASETHQDTLDAVYSVIGEGREVEPAQLPSASDDWLDA